MKKQAKAKVCQIAETTGRGLLLSEASDYAGAGGCEHAHSIEFDRTVGIAEETPFLAQEPILHECLEMEAHGVRVELARKGK